MKRLLSAILTLIMIFALLPAAALTANAEPADGEGLRIAAASLLVHQDIVVRYAAIVPTGMTDPYMVVEVNGQRSTLQPSGEDSKGRLLFEVTTLTPDMMGDNVSATLYATSGDQLVSDSKPEYSIRQYCLNLMAAYPDDESLQTLLADMLVYGAATQTFTGHNASALVTAGVDLSNATVFNDLTAADSAFSKTGTADEAVCWTGVGLVCGSRMTMYFDLTTTVGAATSVEITINGRTTTYPYAAIKTGDPTVCRVLFRGIAATEYGDTVTAVLKNNGTQVGETMTYSVDSYVYSMQHNTEYENLAPLVQAICNYGNSAKNYVESLGD
ncbi:MAG: hypothetical protein IJJ99_06565 [Oscillospiraceae bacterium]|nr:hypothetical protein [Oscillospiraceae bacterium]